MAKQFYNIDADLIERIKSVMQEENVRASAFAERLGYSESSLSKNLNGKRPVPPSLIDAIIRVYSINRAWLISGKGDMKEEAAPSKSTTSETQSLPLIPVNAMAGALSGNDISIMEYDCERYIVPIFKGAEFLIRVQGDSMTPLYFAGDLLACQRIPLGDIWFQWGKAYVLDTRQGALVKRIEPSTNKECVSIHSENPKNKPFDLPIAEISGIALVKGIIRVE